MTPEERVAALMAGWRDLPTSAVPPEEMRFLGRGTVARIAERIADAIREAVKDRDIEWWRHLALVDNVAPTPEAVRDYILRCERLLWIEEEREACAMEAESQGRATLARYESAFEALKPGDIGDTLGGVAADACAQRIAAAIRARGKT